MRKLSEQILDKIAEQSSGKPAEKKIASYSFSLSPAEELLYVIRTICKNYSIPENELIIFDEPSASDYKMTSQEMGSYFVKKIPIDIPVPENLQTSELKKLSLLQMPRSSRSKHPVGISEYYYLMKDCDIPPRKNPNKITFWMWTGCQENYPVCVPAFFIQRKDWFFFLRSVSRRGKRGTGVEVPILPRNILSDIYQNTIGFLLKGKKTFDKYNMPFKRGIIISSSPGLGKTLSCRWLKQLCRKHNFQTKIVTLQDYKYASAHGRVDLMFNPFHKKKGIVFFDDLDILLKDRKSGNIEVSNFLSGLDGIDVKEGIVYVFTTNEFEGLDKAAIRPNRIDLFIKIKKPDKELRTEFIRKKFPPEVLSQIDTSSLVEQSDDYSFAELEEVRRLFCLDLIDNRKIDLAGTISLFKEHRKEFPNFPSIGFKTGDYDENDIVGGCMPIPHDYEEYPSPDID